MKKKRMICDDSDQSEAGVSGEEEGEAEGEEGSQSESESSTLGGWLVKDPGAVEGEDEADADAEGEEGEKGEEGEEGEEGYRKTKKVNRDALARMLMILKFAKDKFRRVKANEPPLSYALPSTERAVSIPEVAYERLAHDMLVLAYEAEAGWKPGFRKLLEVAIAARVTVDSRKDATRSAVPGAVNTCVACGRAEGRGLLRLDLVGAFDSRALCKAANIPEGYREFQKQRLRSPPTDFGIFYLGTECLRKFTTAFSARTYMAELLFVATTFRGSPAPELQAKFLCRKREMLEDAIRCRFKQPPPLAHDKVVFASVDRFRWGRSGTTTVKLCKRGLEAIEHGYEKCEEDDEASLGDDSEEDCGAEARSEAVPGAGAAAGVEEEDGPAMRTRAKTAKTAETAVAGHKRSRSAEASASGAPKTSARAVESSRAFASAASRERVVELAKEAICGLHEASATFSREGRSDGSGVCSLFALCMHRLMNNFETSRTLDQQDAAEWQTRVASMHKYAARLLREGRGDESRILAESAVSARSMLRLVGE